MKSNLSLRCHELTQTTQCLSKRLVTRKENRVYNEECFHRQRKHISHFCKNEVKEVIIQLLVVYFLEGHFSNVSDSNYH